MQLLLVNSSVVLFTVKRNILLPCCPSVIVCLLIYCLFLWHHTGIPTYAVVLTSASSYVWNFNKFPILTVSHFKL